MFKQLFGLICFLSTAKPLFLDKPRLSFKQIIEINDLLKLCATNTIPYGNSEISKLIEDIPRFDNDEINVFSSEIHAKIWLNKINFVLSKASERSAFLHYNFAVNITAENQKLIEEFAPILNSLNRVVIKTSKLFYKTSENFNFRVRRQLLLASRGLYSSNDEDDKSLVNITNELETIFATTKVCPMETSCYSLEPELTDIMALSRDYELLLWAWKSWSDTIGTKTKSLFSQSIFLQNKMAVENGYGDLSEYWLEDFEEKDFENIIDSLYEEILPFYQQLHAYVRRKLRNFYGTDKVPSKLIPAHLLGNMWGQNWENIFHDILIPYPDIQLPRLDELLKSKNYTSLKMFKQAEKFFVSMGLYSMTRLFWKNSMFEKPSDRQVQCHASASDFSNKIDFRIKMCTQLTDEDFNVVHHEMGHIEYYMSYAKQPKLFRTAPNSAFHESIGDTIGLSVATSTHLAKIGFLGNSQLSISYETQINYLMKMALKKIAFVPFGYLIDKWRWNVLRGSITESDYNEKWWQMRKTYQGIESPVERTENHFDPGSKYHVIANVPYARYFISHIYQFQFYRALCKIAKHDGDLHLCDFFGSKEAGSRLKKMMSLGASKHWKHSLKILTGEKVISTNALFEYFGPLIEWLRKENSKHPNDPPGFE